MINKLSVIAVLLCSSALAGASEKTTFGDLASIAETLKPSAVRVEFTLQYDKGDSPTSMDRWMAWQWSSSPRDWYNWEDYDEVIRQERPLAQGGFLLSPTLVVTTDVAVHPRFIKSITVNKGDQSVAAEPMGDALGGSLLHLKLDDAVKTASVLSFDTASEGPYYGVTYYRWNGTWQIAVSPLSSSVAIGEDGRRYASASGGLLIVDQSGVAVGFTGMTELPLDGSWKGSPADQPMITRAELDGVLSQVEHVGDYCLPRVELSFRSPRGDQDSSYGYYYGMGDDQGETEWNGTGVLVDEQRVLVLASFKPDKTARLERIRVHPKDGEAIEATFAGTLKDYGGFLATLESPLPGKVEFFQGNLLDLRDQLLAEAQITVHGENRTAYYVRQRIPMFQVAWEGKDYPTVSAISMHSGGYYGYGTGAMGLNFLFTTEGQLAAIPIERREKVTVEDEWGGDGPTMVPVEYLEPILADTDAHIDPDNRPLTEEEEDRLAWLGVEMQSMTPDLARINDVSHLTSGGMTGALITYVYDNSPAAAKGLQMGDILLRLHVEGQPKPLEVNAYDQYGYMFGDDFWDYIDEMPMEYFDQMPSPWGSVETPLTRALTDVGFGTPYSAEVYRDGEVMQVDFVVEQGPPHYQSAKRFKSEDLGITVRELTYEVRRYYQLGADEPGVIISKVEPGEKAAVAGLRPFELVVSVDDQPISTPDEFEQAMKTPGDRKIFVKRMDEGRIAKITVEAPETEPEE